MRKVWLAVGFTVLLVALGVIDAYVTVEPSTYASLLGTEEQPEEPVEEKKKGKNKKKKGKDKQEENTEPTIKPETPPPTNTPGGVRKQEGPKIETILGQTGWEFKAIKEPLFLSKIIPPEESQVTGTVLLKNGDRIGAIAWVESPKIKLYFIALKEALHSSFTPEIKDLVDETQHREGKPPRNLLTFLDTGINEERIVFVRVRSRLFEIHIADGNKKALFDLIDKLTD